MRLGTGAICVSHANRPWPLDSLNCKLEASADGHFCRLRSLFFVNVNRQLIFFKLVIKFEKLALNLRDNLINLWSTRVKINFSDTCVGLFWPSFFFCTKQRQLRHNYYPSEIKKFHWLLLSRLESTAGGDSRVSPSVKYFYFGLNFRCGSKWFTRVLKKRREYQDQFQNLRAWKIKANLSFPYNVVFWWAKPDLLIIYKPEVCREFAYTASVGSKSPRIPSRESHHKSSPASRSSKYWITMGWR